MKFSTAVVLASMAGGALLSVPIARPYWEEMKLVQRDCAETKPEQRTAEQKKRCDRPSAPPLLGVVIPGVL